MDTKEKRDKFGLKDDKETIECATKILKGMAKNIEKQAVDLGNNDLLDKSFKEDFKEEKTILSSNYANFLYTICKTGQGEKYYKILTKFMERTTEEAKVLNRGLTEKDLKRIFNEVMKESGE